mmetsp:Transcript_11362/g.28087  ORF Transcript_11362/g.28087 Transcript_11362/m.28087 type:complete len:823 (-) Transcript_11362:286-2754(-)
MPRYTSSASPEYNPSPNPASVVQFATARVTALSEAHFRVQLGGHFDDRASYQVTNRWLPAPSFTHRQLSPTALLVATSLANVTVDLAQKERPISFGCGPAAATWTFRPASASEDPLLSAQPVNARGMYAFEDTATARLSGGGSETVDWWKQPVNSTDLYLLCYGASSASDFHRGLAQLASVTGRSPLMPLAAHGVWYSGCCIDALYQQEAVSEEILLPYKLLDLPLDFFVLDFYWHRGGWSGYSFDTNRFPDWRRFVEDFRTGSNAYGSPIKLISNMHPEDYVIHRESEDNYDSFARSMGYDPSENHTFPCDFYDRQYMKALVEELLAPVTDYPWVDCSCTSRGCCTGAEKNKTGADLQPFNLDFQLQTNYALDAIYAKRGNRSLVLNRLPGRADGSNYNDALLNGTCYTPFGSCLRGNLGAHRYPTAWTGDIGFVEQHLVNSIALFPEACASHLWCSFSVDIGPFGTVPPFGTTAPDDPINAARYIRFMQWGAFSAIFRPHDGADADTRIWTFKASHYQILRDVVRLRGAMTPWVYKLAARTHREAWPFCRPMWWDFSQAAAAAAEDARHMPEQYMFGELLVRPISSFVSPSNASTHELPNASAVNTSSYTVWLPPGMWMTWNATVQLVGPARFTFSASLEDTPVFVPTGTVLPLWPPGRRSVPAVHRTRLWVLWLDGNSRRGHGDDYEDDGESLSDHFSTDTLTFSSSVHALDVNISQSRGSYDRMPATKRHALQLRGIDRLPTMAQCCPMYSECLELDLSIEGDYSTAGYWRASEGMGEMTTPSGSIVVVCSPVARRAGLRVVVTFSTSGSVVPEAVNT